VTADHAHPHHGPNAEWGPVADASVRLARVSDAPAVGMVQAAVWREAYAGLLPPEVLAEFEPPAFARGWRTSLGAPPTRAHRLLVACAGEQVVGFAAVGPSPDPDAGEHDAELLAFGVHPDARRAGHGSRLLNAAVDTVRGGGHTSLAVWLLAAAEATRAFLVASGLNPDGAFRDRVLDGAGFTAREIRLSAGLVGTEQ